MTSAPPDVEFYCPVCGVEVAQLWVWQQTGSDRARIFCEGCASLVAYATLPMHECSLFDQRVFDAWAGRRQLRHVFEREHPAV